VSKSSRLTLTRRLIRFVPGVLSVLLALTTVDARAQTASNGEFLLRAPAALINDIAARHNLVVVRQLPGQDLFVVTQGPVVAPLRRALTTSSTSEPTQTTDIGGDPDVVTFEPNSVVSTPEVAAATLNGSVVSILDGSVVSILDNTTLTTYFDNQVWSRYINQPATTAIGLEASHTAVGTGAGIVAVIDTGVDPDHPALAGSLVAGYDFIHETAGIPSEWTDIDGSVVSILDGSVVSILDGHAVTINGSVVAILDQATATALDPSLLPHAFGHGTMVAGLVHLVAPTAQIMPLKAFSADGTSTVFDVVRAIYYAVDHGARVINMSFSATTPSPEMTRAINYATTHGVICVASAGNLGQETVVYPGGLRNVVGVGSTSSTTPPTRSTFTNYGDALVSLGAPGEAVITTYPGAHFAAGWGTSFSAPLAAGAASLLVRVDPAADPAKVADLLAKAQPMTAAGMGKGRLSLPDAVSGAADSVSPAVSLSSPTGGSVFGSVLISASASDNVGVAGVRFLLDGSPLGPEIAAAPFEQMWTTTAAANGSHTVTAIARDRSGNETTTVANVTVANDSAAPSVTLLNPAGGASVSGTVSVTAAATDDLEVAGVRFSVDGTPLGVEDTAAPFEAAWTTTTAANGTHVIAAVARDAAGHQTTASAMVTVTNDSAPTAAITSPAAGATLSGTVSLAAAVSDDTGVASVTFLVDGAAAGVVETPAGRFWNTTTAANGAHVVSVVARDAAGHETTASVEVTVLNDHAPTVALTTPVEGASLGGLVSVLAAATDDIGVTAVQFKVDGAIVGSEDTVAPYELLWDTAGASNGSHTVSAVARDAAGHETTTSVVVVVSNDNVPPTVAFMSPTHSDSVAGMMALVATASDDVGVTSVQFLVDGIAVGAPATGTPYHWLWDTEDEANGSHTLTAIARDAAGHETSTSVVVDVVNDEAPPTLAIVNPPAGPVSGTVPLLAAATDDVGVVSVEFLADGNIVGPAVTVAPYEWLWNSATVANGSHTIWVLARDAAGHETLTSVVVTVANDVAPPSVVLTNPVGVMTVGGTFLLAANAADDIGVTSVQFMVDGAAVGVLSTSAPYEAAWHTGTASNGLHTVSAIARDAAGHESTTSAVVTVANDTAAPTLALTNPVNGSTVSSTVTLSAAATDDVGVTSVEFLVDGAAASGPIAAQPFQWDWVTRQLSGIHTITAVARDAAGHETSTSVQVTVVEDDPPTP